VATGLALLVILSRAPFPGRILYHWDSINFAYALQHFDVAASQPHVPGYILYVALARMVNAVAHDAQRTLVAISVISSGLAVAALYVLGLTWFDRRTALLGAGFLATSPLFWFYGEVALPHSLDCFVVIVAVWLFHQLIEGHAALAVPAAIWLGLAGGLRPQTQLFLMPVAAYAFWQIGWRRSLPALAVLVVVDLAWLVPLVWLTGGPARYLEVTRQFYLKFNTTTSVLNGAGVPGLARNLTKLSMYVLYAWGFALIPAVLGCAARWRSWLTMCVWRDVRVRVWLLWVWPALLYYTFIHMGQQGLVFVFLPALLLLSAVALRHLAWLRPSTRWWLGAGLVVANAILFVAAPTYPLGGTSFKLLTADTLRRHDAFYLTRFEAIRQRFPREHTVVLSSAWRYVQYYLPEYPRVVYELPARWELQDPATGRREAWFSPDALDVGADASGMLYVVLFEDELVPFNQSTARQQVMLLHNDQRLVYMPFTPDERIHVGRTSFGITSGDTAAHR
jgi:4-amino-4-deoxy-L-arabinose transferase-like glycosyltransferase